jgi:hypothetical protein
MGGNGPVKGGVKYGSVKREGRDLPSQGGRGLRSWEGDRES